MSTLIHLWNRIWLAYNPTTLNRVQRTHWQGINMYCTVSHPNKASSVPVWESVPGAKSGGQPIWLKLGTKVGCDKIFQRPLWLTSLNVCSGVWGGSHWSTKNSSF